MGEPVSEPDESAELIQYTSFLRALLQRITSANNSPKQAKQAHKVTADMNVTNQRTNVS